MFLNKTPKERIGLVDQDVDYYGFLTSDEFKGIQDYLIGYLPMDVYDSPYFGQGSGAYRELDKVYEAYRAKFVNRVFPGEDLDELKLNRVFPSEDLDELKRTDASAGISPALILAAAAAFFFAG